MLNVFTSEFIEKLQFLKFSDKVDIKCPVCFIIFSIEKRELIRRLKVNKSGIFCSIQCRWDNKNSGKHEKVEVKCKQCSKLFLKSYRETIRIPTPNHFCSHSCSATYQNTHKTTGYRRSKLEKWLEEQLTILYPDLHIDYNKTNAIESELDIYIPSLKLAVELNGIFHYEPIYGVEKLASIQNNDNRKFQACLERNIELVIIDSSSLKYFKPKHIQKYLDMILSIIDLKLKICPG